MKKDKPFAKLLEVILGNQSMVDGCEDEYH